MECLAASSPAQGRRSIPRVSSDGPNSRCSAAGIRIVTDLIPMRVYIALYFLRMGFLQPSHPISTTLTASVPADVAFSPGAGQQCLPLSIKKAASAERHCPKIMLIRAGESHGHYLSNQLCRIEPHWRVNASRGDQRGRQPASSQHSHLLLHVVPCATSDHTLHRLGASSRGQGRASASGGRAPADLPPATQVTEERLPEDGMLPPRIQTTENPEVLLMMAPPRRMNR
jgi:hypothetical protein